MGENEGNDLNCESGGGGGGNTSAGVVVSYAPFWETALSLRAAQDVDQLPAACLSYALGLFFVPEYVRV